MSVKKTETIELAVPVEFEGKEHKTITLRRLKAKDMRDFSNGGDSVNDTLKIIQCLSGWPPEGIDELDAIDLESIGDMIKSFTTRRR